MVKKPKAKVESSSQEEDVDSGYEERLPTKTKGKRKANITAAQPTGAENANQPKAVGAAKAGQSRVPDDDDADVETRLEGSHDDVKVEMQFDLAA